MAGSTGAGVMIYSLLADTILVVHLLFVLFVVLGGLLCLRWPRVAWAHIPAALWGACIELIGWICPLTPLEIRLRRLGGGTGYSVGDIFSITGGTSTVQAFGIVDTVAAGVVTAAHVIEPGVYTVNPGAAAATVHARIKNGATPAGNDLTVTTTLTTAVAGVTEAELLAAIQGVGFGTLNRNVGDSFDVQVSAQILRLPNSSELYLDTGVPIV